MIIEQQLKHDIPPSTSLLYLISSFLLRAKDFDFGSVYSGPITFTLFAPLPFAINAQGALTFSSPVKKCADDLADYEMSQEMCGQVGSAYSFSVTDPLATYSFDLYPSFGLGG
jgi:hypothetical protein